MTDYSPGMVALQNAIDPLTKALAEQDFDRAADLITQAEGGLDDVARYVFAKLHQGAGKAA